MCLSYCSKRGLPTWALPRRGWADSLGARKVAGMHPTGMLSCSFVEEISKTQALGKYDILTDKHNLISNIKTMAKMGAYGVRNVQPKVVWTPNMIFFAIILVIDKDR